MMAGMRGPTIILTLSHLLQRISARLGRTTEGFEAFRGGMLEAWLHRLFDLIVNMLLPEPCA
jgi:hypothetical protein